jgi:outer membrane protein TolC
LGALAVLLAGCQRYQPAPIDVPGYGALWDARGPADARVVEYARRLAAAGPATAPAVAYDPADGLTLREAEVVALVFNPQLRAARARARVPAVGAAEAGRWADPELNVDAERIIESVKYPWVLGGVLSFTVPLWGRVELERGQAVSEADAARLGVLVEEARVLAELHEQWLELAAIDERAALARRYVEELAEGVSNAERLRAAGELDPVEARLFKIEQVRRRAELAGLESQRGEQEAVIKGTLGLVPRAPLTLVAGSVRVAVAAHGGRAWVEAHHPRVRQARAEYEAAERSLEVEVRKQWPDWRTGGGYGVDEATHRLLGGVAIPLPVFNGNRRAIAEARARREAARVAAEAVYEEVVGGLGRAEIAVEAARGRREFVERELAPLVDEQVADARRLARLGDARTVVLLEALTRAYETRVAVVEAVAREGAAANRLNAVVRPAAAVRVAGEEK